MERQPRARAQARALTTRRYAAHVVPGLESIAAREIRKSLAGARVTRTLARFDDRASVLLVSHAGPPRDLLRLGTTEDVFAVAAVAEELPPGRAALRAVRASIMRSPDFEPAANTASSLRHGRHATFRVIARLAKRRDLRRTDLRSAVEDAVSLRQRRWRLVEDDARLELWVHVVDATLVAAFRLSDATMRHRGPRPVERPAALKPTIARAMVLAAGPSDDEVVCDPMCGSGTIVVERALAAPTRRLLAGDVDADAVASAAANARDHHRSIAVMQWDARRLPLRDGTVDRIITNLPFGERVGRRSEIPALYRAVVDESARVVRPGGTMTLLSADPGLLVRAGEHAGLRRVDQHNVVVRGRDAVILILAR